MILTVYIKNIGSFELCCVIIPVVVNCLLIICQYRGSTYLHWIDLSALDQDLCTV